VRRAEKGKKRIKYKMSIKNKKKRSFIKKDKINLKKNNRNKTNSPIYIVFSVLFV